MLNIRTIIEETILPDFIDRVPLDWGTKGRGTLTAGQWGVLNQVYFPIALIPEWGVPSASAYLKEVLDAQMSLVDALQVTNLLELEREQSYEYDSAMFRHIDGKARLFKDVALVPYDHLALHQGDVMRDYGPSPTHNGAYYERHIRHLHGFNLNSKPGKIISVTTRCLRDLASSRRVRAHLSPRCCSIGELTSSPSRRYGHVTRRLFTGEGAPEAKLRGRPWDEAWQSASGVQCRQFL